MDIKLIRNSEDAVFSSISNGLVLQMTDDNYRFLDFIGKKMYILNSTTNVIDTYVYRGLMEQANVGMSAAAGFYQSIVGFILVITANTVVRKLSPENALF